MISEPEVCTIMNRRHTLKSTQDCLETHYNWTEGGKQSAILRARWTQLKERITD